MGETATAQYTGAMSPQLHFSPSGCLRERPEGTNGELGGLVRQRLAHGGASGPPKRLRRFEPFVRFPHEDLARAHSLSSFTLTRHHAVAVGA